MTHPRNELTIRFFNVGQGNSILLELPVTDASAGKPRFGIIDCFHSPKERSEPLAFSYLKERGVDVLEFVILTHPDKDHYFGLSRVLEYYSTPPRKFKLYVESLVECEMAHLHKYAPRMAAARVPQAELTACATELKKIASLTKNAQPDPGFVSNPLSFAYREIKLTQDLTIQFLAPLETVFREVQSKIVANVEFVLRNKTVRPVDLPEAVDLNSVSLAFLVKWGNGRFLVCGDVKNPQWTQIVKECKASSLPLGADVINVTHHGGQGNPKKLWKEISRKPPATKSIAVISCGYDNQYGHPFESTLNSIFANNNMLFCTNKGDPCKHFDVTSIQTPFQRALASLTRNNTPFNQALATLGASSDICSGTIEVGLATTGQTTITHRDQRSHCEYALSHRSFDNLYPPGV